MAAILTPSSFTLACWQLRQTWPLLLMTGTGLIVAVVLVCTVPLYSRVVLVAGLRALVKATPNSSLITIHNPAIRVLPAYATRTETAFYDQELQQDLAPFVKQDASAQVVFQTAPYTIFQRHIHGPAVQTAQQIALQGYVMDQFAPHIHLLSGRLPQLAQDQIEVALPMETAANLHSALGETITTDIATTGGDQYNLPLRVVGLFKPLSETDTFWHGNDFRPVYTGSNAVPNAAMLQAVVANDAFIKTMGQYLAETTQVQLDTSLPGTQSWYYSLDLSHLDSDGVAPLMNGLDALNAHTPAISSLPGILQEYQNRVTLVQTPVTVLLALITGMVLLFISMIAHLLVENRSAAIAVLRSRGAARRQIFGAFVAQFLGIALLVLVSAPLLAISSARLLAHMTLSPSDQGALSILAGDPIPIALNLLGYALLVVLTATGAGILTIHQATKLDVLALRRLTAGRIRRPFWQRFYLDFFAAVLAVSGYAIALYETNTGTLNTETQIVIVSPLLLLTAALAMLACLLLFLRSVPFLLHQATLLAARSRSALPALALAQVSRAPRQALGMTLLLSLTTAFSVFTLLFTASQVQHVADVAAYIAGADFSGTIIDSQTTPTEQIALYRQINGVTAASVGYTTTAFTAKNVPVGLKAVESQTFAHTASWSDADSPQSLSSLMERLIQERAGGIARHIVPALVDATTWDTLALSPGQSFKLADATSGTPGRANMVFVAIARVEHIPTYSNGLDNSEIRHEGVLVDFQNYAHVYDFQTHDTSAAHVPLTPNYFWLRTRNDVTSLTMVRQMLKRMQDRNGIMFYDRRTMNDILSHDPLYLDLLGVLALGIGTPLLLALVGCLIGTWLHLRERQANFTILRALGTAPGQIVGLLTWEQGPIYAVLLLLGIAAGWLLSSLSLPALVISGILAQATAEIRYLNVDDVTAAPNLPSTRLVIPGEAVIALIIVIAICAVALGLIIRAVVHSSFRRMSRVGEE